MSGNRPMLFILSSISEITLEKVMRIPSDAKVGQFDKKLFMRNSVESLAQVYEYANNLFFISQC